ncbi:hypothetical protein [Paraburkholderia sp. J76]|uniref:hypothetical protein n=1 Tax=Paraburkholderia sp. J76 TaxID=2805439 RepID=UPI002ABE2F84|nr:hypothetical protein [Paraburkholderia sp. J76]
MNPLEVLKAATDKAPVLTNAWVILGFVAVLAIIKGLNVDYRLAIVGVVVLLLLVVVVKLLLTDKPDPVERVMRAVLQIFTALLFMGVVVTLAMYVIRNPSIVVLGAPQSSASAASGSTEASKALAAADAATSESPSTRSSKDTQPEQQAATAGKVQPALPSTEAQAEDLSSTPSAAQSFFETVKGSWHGSHEVTIAGECADSGTDSLELKIDSINAERGEIVGTYTQTTDKRMKMPSDLNQTSAYQQGCINSTDNMKANREGGNSFHSRTVKSGDARIVISDSQNSGTLYLEPKTCRFNEFGCKDDPSGEREKLGALSLENGALRIGDHSQFKTTYRIASTLNSKSWALTRD